MTNYALDKLDLQILEKIIEGTGIEFNYTTLSETAGKHRSTIIRRVDELLANEIISPPNCFPRGLIYDEFPLLITVFADLPNEAENLIREDPNIFAGFYIIEENYNVLLFEYHKTVKSYQLWRERLTLEKKIPSRATREPSTSHFLSNELIEKYDTSAVLELLEEFFTKKKQKSIKINDFELDYTSFEILKSLIKGKLGEKNFLRINENKLAQDLGKHRKTIEQHIKKLINNGTIESPSCYFVNFFAPKGFFLVFSLVEPSADMQSKFINIVQKDPHVPLLFRVSAGKYNLAMLSAHGSADELLEWNQNHKEDFIRTQKVIILSPNSIIYLDQLKIARNIISKRMSSLEID